MNPIAEDDTATTPQGVPVVIYVTKNDSDPEEEKLTLKRVMAVPSHGTAKVNPDDGTAVYAPKLDFTGTDGFKYEICNESGGCDTAKVIITVVEEQITNPTDDGEGCSPGFWKQIERHSYAWVGFSPSDSFNHVFGLVACAGESETDCSLLGNDVTLLDAMKSHGSKFSRLVSHAVAALLNAMQDDVDYNLSPHKVIKATATAIRLGNYETLKDELDFLNNQDCPLGNEEQEGESRL